MYIFGQHTPFQDSVSKPEGPGFESQPRYHDKVAPSDHVLAGFRLGSAFNVNRRERVPNDLLVQISFILPRFKAIDRQSYGNIRCLDHLHGSRH